MFQFFTAECVCYEPPLPYWLKVWVGHMAEDPMLDFLLVSTWCLTDPFITWIELILWRQLRSDLFPDQRVKVEDVIRDGTLALHNRPSAVSTLSDCIFILLIFRSRKSFDIWIHILLQTMRNFLRRAIKWSWLWSVNQK